MTVTRATIFRYVLVFGIYKDIVANVTIINLIASYNFNKKIGVSTHEEGKN